MGISGNQGSCAGLWVGALLAGLLSACSQAVAPQEPVRAVKVITVGLSPLTGELEFAGEVRAQVESRLSFRVGGKLVARPAQLGQRVQPGQLLAQLDPHDYQLAASAAGTQVAAALTNRDLARAELKRYQDLKDQGFISGAELERRDATLKSAQAQLEQTQVQLSVQGNQTTYASLRADAAGVVTGVDAEPGQVVSPGVPVLRVALDGPRDVVFAVPEDRVAAIALGSVVQVRGWGAQALRSGVVREVAAAADPVTRTYSVKVGLKTLDALPLGSTVTVLPMALSRSGVQAIKLPTSALRQDGGKTAVWVLDLASMQVRSVPITVATADANDAVVSAGLSPGMLVVSSGVHVLAQGQKVSLYAPPPSPASAASAPTVKGL